MCLQIPAKVISLKNKKIVVKEAGLKRKVAGSLIKVKVGDFVFLKDNFIIGKINQKEAKEILNLMHPNSARSTSLRSVSRNANAPIRIKYE